MNAFDPAELPDDEPFGTWLLGQVGRSGWIGDLAKMARSDRGFPKKADPDTVRRHLAEAQADPDTFEAVDDAERIWLRQ